MTDANASSDSLPEAGRMEKERPSPLVMDVIAQDNEAHRGASSPIGGALMERKVQRQQGAGGDMSPATQTRIGDLRAADTAGGPGDPTANSSPIGTGLMAKKAARQGDKPLPRPGNNRDGAPSPLALNPDAPKDLAAAPPPDRPPSDRCPPAAWPACAAQQSDSLPAPACALINTLDAPCTSCARSQ
jgi:hypothetical protein